MKLRLLLTIVMMLFTHLAMADNTRVIHFATEATYPPFEYIDETGVIKGFDIDIAKALCQVMQVECVFSSQAFSSLIPSLAIGKYDAIIASLGVTADRAKQVNFTDAYYEPSASYITALKQPYSLKQLDNKIIGVQQGSTLENYLRHYYADTMTIKSYASVQEALLDLDAERVDAVLMDTPIAKAWLKLDDNQKLYKIVDHPIVDHEFFGSGYAIAVAKNNPALLHELNQALIKIKENGTYKKIYDAYFGKDK